MYSTTQGAGGPVRTAVELLPSPDWTRVGTLRVPPPDTIPDRNFGIMSEVYSDSVVFGLALLRSTIARSNGESPRVAVRFQVCTTTYCLPARTDTIIVPVVLSTTSATASEPVAFPASPTPTPAARPAADSAVSAVNDGGHSDPAGTGSFAMNPDGTINSVLWTDLATRATHEMTLKTKALVAAYYLMPQTFAYVDGCSGGGRQGFAEAQSFPNDYNGILAGAPSIAQTRFFPSDLYPGFVQFKDLGNYNALSAAQLALVSGAAVSACDTTLTGQHDGYINDPATCNYDPTTDPSVLCTASGGTNSTSSCVTLAQARTFNKVWYGPTSDGSAPSPVADNGVNVVRSPAQLWWGQPRGGKFAPVLTYGLGHPRDQIALNLQNSIYARPGFVNATGNGY